MARKMCLIGRGIAHSKSPQIYAAAFAHLGLDWSYELRECETQKEAVDLIRSCEYDAINVTTPWKSVALVAAEEAEGAAQMALGANLLIGQETGFTAYNTDGSGCVAALLAEGVLLAGARVVVCGTGPTALAITTSCLHIGAQVVLLSRSQEKARVMAESIEAKFLADEDGEPVSICGLGYGDEEASAAIALAQVIIDATSLGMDPDDGMAFDGALLHEGQVVLDVVYGHGDTAIVKAARQARCRVFDGTGMLVTQAAISMQIACSQLQAGCDLAFKPLLAAMKTALA